MVKTYGVGDDDGMVEVQICTISPLGRPIEQNVVNLVHEDHLHKIIRWAGGILGRADTTYPHPDQWTVANSPGRLPLDKIGVRELTAALRGLSATPPNCMRAWEKRIGQEIPWRAVGDNLAYGIGTNRDTSCWFKNILHRGLWLKGSRDSTVRCAICNAAQDNWAHLWECPVWAPMWQSFVDFTNELLPRMNRAPPAMFSPEFVYLGVMRDGHVLPRSLSLLHSLMWKFQIQDMYQRSQNEYYIIKPSETNKRALRRLMTRIHAHEREAQIRRHKAEQKGGTVDLRGVNKKIHPIAHIGEEGIEWEDNMRRWLTAAGAIHNAEARDDVDDNN